MTDAWYIEKRSSEKEERLRLVETAADVILEEIRSVPYAMDDYPPPDFFLDENESLFAKLLKIFLERLTLNKKRGNTNKWEKKGFSHFTQCYIVLSGQILSFPPYKLGYQLFIIRSMGHESSD